MNSDKLTTGLTSEQVKRLTAEGKINGTPDAPTKSVGEIIRTNTLTFFNLVNVILGVLVLLTGSLKNCLFLGVIICNTVIGIFQEIRAKKVIDKLSLISAPKVTVLRDGGACELHSAEIVLGDLMLLNTGRQVCADSTVSEGECEVNESLITGESDPVLKKEGDELLSGSFIVSGSVKAEVIRVGADNFASKITAGAKYLKKSNSVMLKSLDRIIKVIAVCIVPMAIGLFLNAILVSEQSTDRAIVSTVAALIGMIPEGLYLLASVVMAVSVIRLAARKTLAQDMYCTETLARVDVLCLDKTGTITEGIMRVEGTELLQEDFPLDKSMTAFCACMTDDNPTFNAVKAKWGGGTASPLRTLPFSSARKWSGAEFAEGSFIFGAPEFVLRGDYEQIREQCEKVQDEGLRVLLCAWSKNKFDGHELPENITPAALIFIGDVIRQEAPDTLAYFDKQGVDIKIISGDNPVTVSRIARRAGVKNAEMAVDTSALKDDEIFEAARKYSVFGRVTPDRKLALVKALKAQGHTVGMTGDGVNDVLALKEADCSIAMQSGSDAAKHVSSLVLLDGNFASMPKVVAEGRRSVNNIQRSGTLFLTKTVYAFLLALIFIFLPLPYPFEPIQLTLISVTTIGIPSFFLALEPNTDMIRGQFIRNILRLAFPRGAAVAFCAIASVLVSEFTDLPMEGMSTLTAYTVAGVGFLALFRIMKPLRAWKIGLLAGLAVVFAGAAVLFPNMFGFHPLGLLSWITAGVIFGGGAVVMILLEWAADPLFDLPGRLAGKIKGAVKRED
ncbi:MAG: cation-translocating P-type ATPase [Oscillospiraceae bacterium]|nr:cation-translocating P-type ATPase [Oscillospiraceae bacterium]